MADQADDLCPAAGVANLCSLPAGHAGCHNFSRGWRAELARLAAENARLRDQIVGHVERIAKQSDLLSKRAERQPCPDCPHLRAALAAAADALEAVARILAHRSDMPLAAHRQLRDAGRAARAALGGPP